MYWLFNPDTVWVFIPLAAIIGGILLKSQRLRLEATRARGDDSAVTELRDAVRRLEERVGNLERAVTTAEAERKYAL